MQALAPAGPSLAANPNLVQNKEVEVQDSPYMQGASSLAVVKDTHGRVEICVSEKTCCALGILGKSQLSIAKGPVQNKKVGMQDSPGM